MSNATPEFIPLGFALGIRCAIRTELNEWAGIRASTLEVGSIGYATSSMNEPEFASKIRGFMFPIGGFTSPIRGFMLFFAYPATAASILVSPSGLRAASEKERDASCFPRRHD